MLRHLPNLICLVRIALIWPTIDALQTGEYWTALVLVAVCAVSDGLDGWLAKRFNWTSHLGKILDPLADKTTAGGAVPHRHLDQPACPGG